MKNTFTLLLILLSGMLQAQPSFYGVSDFAGGSLYRYEAGANTLATVYQHKVQEVFPTGTLLPGTDGRLYGTALSGGLGHQGGIFSYDAATGTYTTLYQFDETSGSQPTGALTWGSNGLIYGLTTYGGQYNNGVLFSFNPASRVYKVLYHFNGTDGANPTGGLTLGANGLLYGLTQMGGASGSGVLFSFNTQSGVFRKRFDFDPIGGIYPEGGLTKGPDGQLYGATAFGGPEWWQSGSIFRYNPAKDTLGHLYYFNASDNSGYALAGGFCFLPDGKIYGATANGGTGEGGVIFQFDPVTAKYNRIYNFSDATGIDPGGALVKTATGKLVGTTRKGNTQGYGGIFEFDPKTKSFSSLYAFGYSDGIDLAGSLSVGADGRLFGVAPFGGNTEYGTLFAFNTATRAFSKLKEFDEAPNGMYPVAAPAPHTDGLLYGSTVNGGNYGKGVIYAFNPGSQTYQTVFRFTKAHGQYMGAAFIRGVGGVLYGMLSSGGTDGSGQIFAFNPDSKDVQVLHNFEYAQGAYPEGGLLPADDGGFWGVTSAGGPADAGTLFYFNPATGGYEQKAAFDGANGMVPMDGLTRGADKKLYGVTQLGGASNLGVLYVFDPATASLQPLVTFSGSNGANPLRGLVLAGNKKLYGTTPSGGNHNKGVLFSFDPATKAYAVLYHFDGTGGAYPSGRLSVGADGKLYGVTRYGGAADKGVVFVFDPATNSFAKTKDFDGSGTAHSITSALTEYCSEMLVCYRDEDGDGFGAGTQTLLACKAPVGYAPNNTDCNDKVASVYPGAAEVCGNGIDDNCNGQVDEQCGGQKLLVQSSMLVKEEDGQAKLVLKLAQPAKEEIKVNFKTQSGTAKAGLDFGTRAGILKWSKGSTTATITISIFQDQLVEGNETFKVNLFNARGIVLDKDAVVITIRDKQPATAFTQIAAANRPAAELVSEGKQLMAYPNPSTSYFVLVPQLTGKEPYSLTVSDASGKIVEVLRGLPSGQPVTIGQRYQSGWYLVNVVQNGVATRIKLLKQAN